MKLTRRAWTASLLGSTAAAAQEPAAPKPPQSADEWLEAQRRQVARNIELLASHKLPVETEPAFVFKP